MQGVWTTLGIVLDVYNRGSPYQMERTRNEMEQKRGVETVKKKAPSPDSFWGELVSIWEEMGGDNMAFLEFIGPKLKPLMEKYAYEMVEVDDKEEDEQP